MSVDKFGRSSFYLQQKHGYFEISREDEEVINAKKRRIINLESPSENNDATNKIYVDKMFTALKLITNGIDAKISALKKETKDELISVTSLKVDQNLNETLTKFKTNFLNIFKTYYKTENIEPKRTLEEKSLSPTDPVTIKGLQEICEIWLMND